MKVVILSNINSDLHSFVALLDELAHNHPTITRLINLGDLVGNGNLSNHCLEIARYLSLPYFNVELVDDRAVCNCLKLGGMGDPDALIRIVEYLKQGVLMHSLVGRHDMATFNRDMFTQSKQNSLKKIKHENLIFLLWHQYSETRQFINRMQLKQEPFSSEHNDLEVRFAYGSWLDSYNEQIESYKQLSNQLADAGEKTLVLEKRIKIIQIIINKNFARMKHWQTIMFVGGSPDPLLFYKKTEQSQQWFIYEEALEPGRVYSIETNSKYIVTPGSLGCGQQTLDHVPGYIILDIPDRADNKPTFTFHTLSLGLQKEVEQQESRSAGPDEDDDLK